jgi:DNA-directed RNA polymerase subunit RPC12/RpoP
VRRDATMAADFDTLRKLKWIESYGVAIRRELNSDNDWVFKYPGDAWVECWRCGRQIYIEDASDDKCCPNCGFDGFVEYRGKCLCVGIGHRE